MNNAAPSHSAGSPDNAAVALKGASLAFGRSPAAGCASSCSTASAPDPSQLPEAGPGGISRSRSPRGSGANTISSNVSSNSSHYHHHGDGLDMESPGYQASLVAARFHQLSSSSPLQPCTSAQHLDPKNPSFIAATLAASRSVSPSPLVPTSRRKISFGAASALADSAPGDAVDSESIPPTGNLISLYEKGRESGSMRRQSPPRRGGSRAREKRLSATSLGSRPKPKPKPKPKPSLTSPRLPTPPLPVAAAASYADQAHVLQSSRLPTPPLRSAEKISAMPMPKPKLPPQLSSPPQPNNNNNNNNNNNIPSRCRDSPIHERPGRMGPSPSPSPLIREKPAATRAPRVSPTNLSSISKTSAPEVLSPKPMRLARSFLTPPASSSPTRPISPGESSQSPSSSPSPDLEKQSMRTSLQAPTPLKNVRPSPKSVTSQPTRRSRHDENSGGERSVMMSKVSVLPRTEFGLPAVSPVPPPLPPYHGVRSKESPPSLPSKRDSVANAPTSPGPGPRSSRRRLTIASTSNTPLDNLTNAMMASSLASKRLTPHNTGPSLPPPSLPRRQKSPRLLPFTLRQPQSHDDEDPERVKIAHRHKLSSNKHAHHEGARNRWRDQITQRERKRYEAIWASNRGHLLHVEDDSSPSDDSLASTLDRIKSECVANVVVREIWKRSRLPQDELMEVWELVDRGQVGMLTRQEFIVGMWLIDQRLRGRKLPVRVSDSVWDSANGVRVWQPRGK